MQGSDETNSKNDGYQWNCHMKIKGISDEWFFEKKEAFMKQRQHVEQINKLGISLK